MKVVFKNIKLEFQKDATQNLNLTNGKYVKHGQYGDGTLTDNADGYYTHMQDITNFSTLKCKVYSNTIMYAVAFYSDGASESALVSYILDSISIVGDGNTTERTIDLSTAKAAGAKYVIVSHYGSGTIASAYATLIP